MSSNLYYGEIAAKISAHLFQNPDHISQIEEHIGKEPESDTIWTICADAAKVFDAIEDLSGEHLIDWHKALDHFSDEVLDHLLEGEIPQMIDLISMVSLSIQNVRLEKLPYSHTLTH